jgi:hypothetical protein
VIMPGLIGTEVFNRPLIGYGESLVGRLGNQLFQMNLLFQLARILQASTYSRPWSYSYLFKEIDHHSFRRANIFPSCWRSWKPKTISFTNWSLIEIETLVSLTEKKIVNLPVGILGEAFFHVSKVNPRELFLQPRDLEFGFESNAPKVGVHFRGGDFQTWNPKAILKPDFYLNSIKVLLDRYDELEVFISTDDPHLSTYLMVSKELERESRIHTLTSRGSLFSDFWGLANCDYVVSSPSTFAIWASLLGVKKRSVFHSADWLNQRLQVQDEFWVDLMSEKNSLIPVSSV